MSNYFLHPKSFCESSSIGENTKILAFTHVLPEAVIGEDCTVCEHVFIENKVAIGDRVTIKCGVQLWDNTCIENDVFIGPNVTFANSSFSHSKQQIKEDVKTIVKKGASIGANATLFSGITIEKNAIIEAGAVVTHNVPANAIVSGNPAIIIGYCNEFDEKNEVTLFALPKNNISVQTGDKAQAVDLHVKNCKLLPLKVVEDLRGNLLPLEFVSDIPFLPQRQFFVYSVPNNKERGEHAHKVCEQFLIALRGSVRVLVDDAQQKAEVVLDSPAWGLYLAPEVWGVQYQYSEDCLLCVFASHNYDTSDYIRNYDDFIEFTVNQNK